ncbi:MAG TPA: hypothetical protein PLY93_03805 [Turneriella sp.]|nr:hypothetical protein [Turneriella sp.]
MREHRLILFLAILLALAACSTTTKRLDADKDITADSGELTRGELEKAADNLAQKVGAYMAANKPAAGVFVAFLPTKNDTSDQLPVNIFDNRIVDKLLAAKIYAF